MAHEEGSGPYTAMNVPAKCADCGAPVHVICQTAMREWVDKSRKGQPVEFTPEPNPCPEKCPDCGAGCVEPEGRGHPLKCNHVFEYDIGSRRVWTTHAWRREEKSR